MGAVKQPLLLVVKRRAVKRRAVKRHAVPMHVQQSRIVVVQRERAIDFVGLASLGVCLVDWLVVERVAARCGPGKLSELNYFKFGAALRQGYG